MAQDKEGKAEGLKADYGDATPEQVAEAVLRYRPKPPTPTLDESVNPKI